ncbi:KH domain-containing protein [Botrytis cinerea]
MNKLSNLGRDMRHWSGPGFGMSRQNQMNGMSSMPPHTKPTPSPALAPTPADSTIHYSFNIPFASDLAGPNTEDILYATANAVLRWTHPKDAPDDIPVWKLPVHTSNIEILSKLCAAITNGPLPILADVAVTTPKRPTASPAQVTTVTLSGSPELVHKSRETILNDTPIALRCAVIDVDGDLIIDSAVPGLRQSVVEHLDKVAAFCGVDIFILGPKFPSLADGLSSNGEAGRDQRWRIAVYGDMESAEHGKTRILVYIDRLLGRVADVASLELSLHTVYKYCPEGAQRRNPEEIFITGDRAENIAAAKSRIHELVRMTRLFMKDAHVTAAKIDSILLTRMDKVRKIMETNGTFIQFPALASQRSMIRIQGIEGLHVERTVRELMLMGVQFYSASWWIQQPPNQPPLQPAPPQLRAINIPLNKRGFAYQIRVKLELANEHKEFVSGKKNGKINKIMGQSNVQIIFDGFNEYNFNIDVCGNNYDQMVTGLNLVEQEMPAQISFHVPDQYHKRIIGIGGQHIQRIMKKHSVFVKFSNVMDRGGPNREDDDIKADNVICRTPARNAQNLELVKAEILDMVDRVDSEFTSQTVNVDRLYHRELLTRLDQIEDLEKKWNCKVLFPSTEQASDDVTISGPEWQVPHCVDEFLGMVPDSHELVLARTPELLEFLSSNEFKTEMVPKLKSQYVVEVQVDENSSELTEDRKPTIILLWTFTRNNAGGVRDAIEFLFSNIAAAGIEVTTVKGTIPRPKSDSFEESLPFFNSKLLQHAPAPMATDSPTKSSFGDDVARERSNIFDKLRKPGSMSSISSFLNGRKNSSQSPAGSFFRNGSRNASRTSLISIESTRSFNADRNPWNDSGVNLPDDDTTPWPTRQFGTGSGSSHDNKHPHGHPGDATPRHSMRASTDSGRPSTSNSTNSGYPGPIGPPRS